MASTPRQPALLFILITVLIDVIGIGLIVPVLPALVAQFTTTPDAQAYWYGALAASFGLAQFVCSPLLGALSDKVGRRPIILLGVTGLGLNFALSALASSLMMLLIARLIGGALSANVAVANAYIADITPADQRSKRFGQLGAAFGVGFILGPVLGGLLGDIDVRLPFAVAAGLALLNALYGLFVLPESLPRERRGVFVLAKANPFASLKHLLWLKDIGALVVVIALANLTQYIVQVVWVLYTGFRFGWGPRENGLSLFVVGIVAAAVQGGLLGWLLKRFGARAVAIAGLASGTLAYCLYGLATEGWMMIAIVVANLLAFATGSAMTGMVSAATDARAQGRTMGALSSLNSLMSVLAPVVGTPLLASVSHLPPHDWRIGAPFFLCSALQFIALLLAARFLARSSLIAVAQR